MDYAFFLWKYRFNEEGAWKDWYFRAHYFFGNKRGMIPEKEEEEGGMRLNFDGFAQYAASLDGITVHYLLAADSGASDRIESCREGRIQLARVDAGDLALLDDLIIRYLQKKSKKEATP